MKICFPDAERQALFGTKEKLDRAYGQELAHLIICNLSVLQAVPSLAQIPCDRLFELKSEAADDAFSIRLGEKYRLYFKAILPGIQSPSPSVASHLVIHAIDTPAASTRVFP